MLVALCTGISAHLYSSHAEHSSHEGGVSRCVPLQPCTYMKKISFEWQGCTQLHFDDVA